MIRKHFKGGFTAVDNGLINDPTLSAKAKGILIYLLSKPDNWRPIAKDITNHMLEGETAIRSGMKELEQQGYLKLVATQGEGGRLTGTTWEVADYKAFSEFQKTPNSENPSLGKPRTNNTIDKANTESNSITGKARKTLFRNAAISEEDWMEKFKAEHEAGVDIAHYYHSISDWSDSSDTKRTRQGWFATMRTFCRRDKDKGKLRMTTQTPESVDDMRQYLSS